MNRLFEEDLKDLEKLAPSYFNAAGELIQVSFSLYQVILRFERLTIEIFKRCQIHDSKGKEWVWVPERVSDMSGFAGLLGYKIQAYRISPEQHLRLMFSNDCELVLQGDESGYESLVITGADAGWIVIH